MKTSPLSLYRTFSAAAPVAVLSLSLALMPAAYAKDKGPGHGHGNGPAGKGHGNSGKHDAGPPKHEIKFDKHAPKIDKKIEKNFVNQFKPKGHPKVVYLAYPRSSFVLSPGIGYAGRGYYYGPPNSPYYYEAPDVRFFPNRQNFPRGYAFQPNNQYAADEIAVQEALARLGYYQGPVDGRIGPQTLNAIARYQQDHNMSVTNSIVPALLRALGVQ